MGACVGKGISDQHGSFLEERMDSDFGLLDKLLANNTLYKKEYDNIKGHQLFYERNARLLHYISKKKKYDSLIDALWETRQIHLVNYLLGNGERRFEYGDDWPIRENDLSILDTNRESLVDLVDCSDLLTRLFSAQVINGRQRETISSESANYRRNEILLDIIRRCSINDYRQVIRCLHESNQSHVAEILDKGGVLVRVHAHIGNDKDADYTEDDIVARFTDILSVKSLDEVSRILKQTELKIIAAKKGLSVVLYVYCRTAKELLVLYEMNLSGKLRNTLQQLFSQLLLTSSAAEHEEVTIENRKDVTGCASTHLLYRSQMESLIIIISTEERKKCLSYFSYVCRRIRAVCDLDKGKLGRREYKELSKMLLPLSRKDDPDSFVLNFKKGDYMLTTSPENIGDKSLWWKVEHLGDGIIGCIPRNHVVIDYSQELIATSRYSGLLKRPTTSTTIAPSYTTTKLLDLILQKSYLHYALNRDRFKDESDRFMVTRLATVDRCWSERLRKRRFKRIIWRRLSIAFNITHRDILILRSNQPFLMETMRLREGLINQLRLCDCLTDIKSRLLNRQTITSGKRKLINRNNSSDLLHVMRSYDDTRRSDCQRCFRQSGQKLITKVIDNGGVVIKVNLCGTDAINLHYISESLNDINDESKLRLDTTEAAIRLLGDSGIQFFHSNVDRQSAVLYFWCKSEVGHENLRKLCESNSIVGVIGDLTKYTSSARQPIGSRMIDVDIWQFKKTLVVCPIIDRFVARLVVNENEMVKGVTMLRQEICVLCRTNSSPPNAIRVFQNRNPFRLNTKIDIGEVEYPNDIGSSDEQNCLFVIDSKEKCVWKIGRQTGDHHVFLHLQSTHFPHLATLSVSCDGHELLILTLSSLDIYRAFGPEGAAQKQPVVVIQLASDIEEPLHTVETSSGHFVILHSLKQEIDETGEKKRKPVYVVSKVTRDGRLVVRRFVPQNKTQELNGPCYLALDSDDRVLVSDAECDRVILLDSDLTWMRNICLTEDEDKSIKTPYRLCYDKEERQLIVAEFFRPDGANVYNIDMK